MLFRYPRVAGPNVSGLSETLTRHERVRISRASSIVSSSSAIQAAVFDLDGVLLDSEQVWNDSRRELAERCGGHWSERVSRAMFGMSSLEWSRFMHDELQLSLSPQAISDGVAELVLASYRRRLPELPGADAAVRRLAARWPLGLASSSNREVIDVALAESGWGELFAVTVSSEEVARGKPAPDVYLEAVRQLRAAPRQCVAIEDSAPGIASAREAQLAVIAVPNRAFPPDEQSLALAELVLDSIGELDVAAVERLTARDR